MRHPPLRRRIFQKYDSSTAKLPVKHKNMDRQEEHQSDREGAVEDQDNGKLIQNQTEQAGGEGDDDYCKKQPALYAQFLTVDERVNKAQQQEKDGCQLVDADTCQRHMMVTTKLISSAKFRDFFIPGSLPPQGSS